MSYMNGNGKEKEADTIVNDDFGDLTLGDTSEFVNPAAADDKHSIHQKPFVTGEGETDFNHPRTSCQL